MSDLFSERHIPPMLLWEEKQPFNSEDHVFELKLDGIRCIAYLWKDTVLENKRFRDVTALYPELAHMHGNVRKKTVLDGELVVMRGGKPDFYALQRRSLMTDPFRISLAAKKTPAEFCAFDILYYDGKDLTDLPLTERKKILFDKVKEGGGLTLSRHIERNGIAFFALAKREELEGIVAKKKDGKYYIGKRTREWVKIKVMQDEDLLVLGFMPDGGGAPKDLILGCYDEKGKLNCRGKVYLGVSKEERQKIMEFAEDNTVERPWAGGYEGAVWLKPLLLGTCRYMQNTPAGGMRQPVWKGLKE